MNMETTHLVTEFITHTGANTQDAVSCLKSWEWDLKKALIDYNDTSTTEYFNNKKNENEGLMIAQSSTSTSASHLYGSAALQAASSSMLPSGTGSMLPSSATFGSNQRQQQPLHHHIHDSHYPYLNGGNVITKNGSTGAGNGISNSCNNIPTLHMQTPAVKLGAAKSHRNAQYHHYSNAGSSSIGIPTVGISPERCNNGGMNLTSVTQAPIVHLKPMLTKADSVDIFDYKKLERGISRATENVTLVSRARQEFEMDFHAHIHEQNDKNLNFIDTPDYTFTLPDLTKYTDDFRKFLEKDLIENSTLSSLEATNRLNWWYESGACRKLWPLATTGDGNCLLHAASLAMWGFHDRRLTLRRTLHDILSKEEFRDALYRRWRFQQTRVNKQAGFVFCESEWAKEWEEIVAIASPEPRRNSKSSGPSRRRSLLIEKNFDAAAGSSGASDREDESATYESLEEIHVLALAHILRRTIIVVSDVFLRDINGEAFSPIPFGGVYLPFEVPSNECHRAPLLLAYDMAHFSALVAMEAGNDSPPALIPLVDESNQLLPIQFCIDPGKDFNWREYDGSHGNWTLTDREHIALLKEYLDIVHAVGIESPDDEIYYDDYSDDEYEKKIADGEIVFAADENYNHNVGTTSTGSSSGVCSTTSSTAPLIAGGTVTSMTASNQSLPSGGNGKDGSGKSKAAKQLQSVAKQFGSIGKSMSRKLRKNIGSITRIGSKNSGSGAGGANKKSHFNDKNSLRGEYPRFRILCAQLKSRRHEYQEEMIKNYLECAQERYLEAEKMRDRKEMERLTKYVAEVGQVHRDHEGIGTDGDVTDFAAMDGGEPVNCINAGCLNYGTAATSYMCLECYDMQCKRESSSCKNVGDGNVYLTDHTLRYGTGKSKFYAEADMDAHDRIQKLPSARRLNDLDQTLYLSRSTFYNDTKPENIHSMGGGHAYKHGHSGAGSEHSPGLDGHVRQHSYPHQTVHNPNNHLLHQHHHNYHRGEESTKLPQQPMQPSLATGAPASEYPTSAKPPIGPPSSGSTASSSSGIVASMFSPGGGISGSNNGSHAIPSLYSRASAVGCVVNLPPVASTMASSSALVGPLVNSQNDGLSPPYGSTAGAGEGSRSSHPFSSSSSSSSIGVASVGGTSGSQSSVVPIVNSSHYGKNQLCRTEGCKFYGSINTNFYCSKCCQEYNI